MSWQLRDATTRRLTPFARSLVGASVLVVAAAAYYVFVGFWVGDSVTRDKFDGVDPARVEAVELSLDSGNTELDSSQDHDKVTALVNALRQARTRQGYQPPKDAKPGFIRVRLKGGAKLETITVLFPAQSLQDRLGPEVAQAARAAAAAGRPKAQ